MASAETCPLNDAHPPKAGSITAFEALLPEIKTALIQLRHKHDKHEPEYFASVRSLSDADLAHFTVSDLESVRIGTAAYGLHIFGKIRLPKTDGGYIHVRVFVGGGEGDGEKTYRLHNIHTEEKEGTDGEKSYRAIMKKDDELVWFNE